MTTDSVFILFKKTDFNTILACLGGKVYIGEGGHKIFVAKIGRVTVLSMLTFCKFGTPLPKKMPAPLVLIHTCKLHSSFRMEVMSVPRHYISC